MERLDYKVRKIKCDVDFLTACQQQDLLPKFLQFKLYDRSLHQTRLYRNCQRQFLRRELKSKEHLLKVSTSRLASLTSELRSVVTWIDYNHLASLVERTNCTTISRVKFVQDNKLRRLGYVNEDGIPYEKTLFNYSNRILSDIEKKVLSKGLQYVLSYCKPDFINHFCTFEVFFKNIMKHDFYDDGNKGFEFFRCSLKHLAHSTFYDNNSNFVHNLNKEEYNALLNLSKDDSIVIMKPDKGNGVVILDKNNYKDKIKEVLNDFNKFERIYDDVLLTIMNKEEKVNRYLRNLKSEGVINELEYSKLFASGSRPGILYGLPKVHKNGCPIRPIMSAIGTFNYKLSKFMVPILAPTTTNAYSVKDSFSFVKEICNMNVENCVMASFDVKSLFTNIPLKETVNICIEKLFHEESMVFGFSKEQLHKLLSLAVTDCYFLFNDKVYKQKDGVAIGNPLGTTLANEFLAYHEKGG